MIPVPCETCRCGDECPYRGVMAREAVFAWLDDRLIECDDYDPAGFHGLEGVRP